ncbi:hypothetical protein DP117_23170 [Brasilonema sp. UFV-L1]|nr:hypothetical protein [Brasilonema sp. UFV-L1]
MLTERFIQTFLSTPDTLVPNWLLEALLAGLHSYKLLQIPEALPQFWLTLQLLSSARKSVTLIIRKVSIVNFFFEIVLIVIVYYCTVFQPDIV